MVVLVLQGVRTLRVTHLDRLFRREARRGLVGALSAEVEAQSVVRLDTGFVGAHPSLNRTDLRRVLLVSSRLSILQVLLQVVVVVLHHILLLLSHGDNRRTRTRRRHVEH